MLLYNIGEEADCARVTVIGPSNTIKSYPGDLEVILGEEFAQLTELLKTDFASLMLAPDKTFQSYSIPCSLVLLMWNMPGICICHSWLPTVVDKPYLPV